MKIFPKLRSSLHFIFSNIAIICSPLLLSAQINVTITATRVSCFGATDGQATANPKDGWFPYTYAWSNGGTTQTIQNLGLGTYTVTVTDIDQNTKSATGNVTSPNNIALNMSTSAQICSVAPDGIANCLASGGTKPYSYLWSNGSTPLEINHLIAGTYTVTMTDSKGCTKQKSVQVEDATNKGLLISKYATPSSCFYKLGKVNIYMESGTAPYQFLWSNNDTTTLIENLDAGTYTVSVTDKNGCSATASAVVIDEGLPLSSSMTYTSCGYSVGTAIVNTTIGAPPFKYMWSTGETTQNIDSLAAGTYTATVTDAGGCSGTEEAYVLSDGGFAIPYLLSTPKCLNQIATFVGVPPPPQYPEMFWSVSSPVDQIISGQGTDSIQVKWGSIGHKLVTMRYGINGVYCGGNGFEFDVFVCAETTAPDLSNVMVSPNPFSDFLQIEFLEDKPEDVRMILTDVSGKTVLAAPLQGFVNELLANNLPPGMYFLKVKSGKGERVWKLVRN